MKLIYGYLILFISFFGLIYLRFTVDTRSKVNYRVLNPKQESNTIMHDRIKKLETVVDSMALAYAEKPKTPLSSEQRIPILDPTPQIPKKLNNVKNLAKNPFKSLNDAAKVRDMRTRLSLVAQDYINLAYEMSDSSWYGAENIWDTEAFKLRALLIHKDDG